MTQEPQMDVLEGEKCPFCLKDTLILREMVRDIPYFGNVILFSMECQNEECGYIKSDLEAEEQKDRVKCTFEISSEDDLKVRVVKSSTATIKLPRIGSIEATDNSNGYVTNVEGVLNRMKNTIEKVRDSTDDNAEKKKAKNLLKKLTKIMWGQEKITMTLEDPNGNSAIISEKTVYK